MNTILRWLALGLLLVQASNVLAEPESHSLGIAVLDSATRQPMPCRVHLSDAGGRPVRAPGLPFWHDHFDCPGQVQLKLAPGDYTYAVERGPEYQARTGRISMSGEDQQLTIELERLADLAAEGWWSGELHVHRPIDEMDLLMRAEDLHVAPVITWWNDHNLWSKRPRPEAALVQVERNRCIQIMGGEDEREGGALLYFNLPEPLRLAGASREFPSPMQFVKEARRFPGVWVDIEKPFWWDVPIWLAGGQVNSIGIANNHMCRSQMYEDEAWGKPRDAQRLPPPLGNGLWTQEIYYQILNCGLRVPPSAGSASGVLPNPVGYNRVYVYLGQSFDFDRWWDGLREGRSFVSNGPLLRATANSELPGHVFRTESGHPLVLRLEGTLTSRDTVSALEIIRNGRLERAVPLTGGNGTNQLGTLEFKESGWFLIRALADNPKTFRFASTAPFYVEVGATPRRISKASAKFFLDWVKERKLRVRLADEAQRKDVLSYHEMAERFWSDLATKANAE